MSWFEPPRQGFSDSTFKEALDRSYAMMYLFDIASFLGDSFIEVAGVHQVNNPLLQHALPPNQCMYLLIKVTAEPLLSR